MTTMLVCILALFGELPAHAAEIVIFGDSWAEPMGPALRTVLRNHGHEDVRVYTTEFWGLAERLGSAEGLAYITEQLDLHPAADIVIVSEGYNDVHCELINSACEVRWRPSMADTQAESAILDSIVLATERIVDHIAAIRPDARVLLQSYDFMRPLAEMGTKGTPEENNAVHLKWAERVQELSYRKPTLTFVDLHGLMQVTYGFDGVKRTPYDPGYVIPPGDPSLPDPALPSPYFPFGNDLSHLAARGYETLAEGHYKAFYGPLLDDPGSQIGAGHSGAWFNPETSGQGQLIDIDPANQYLFLAWFTYQDDVEASADEPHWFTAQGHYSADTASLTVYETLGGQFAGPGEVVTSPVGEAVLTFSDCGNGQLDYTIETWNRQGAIALERLIPNSDEVCQAHTASVTESLPINAGMDGAWFDVDSPGQGFLLDVNLGADDSNFVFLAWFTYGEETHSGQRWLTAQGTLEGSTAHMDIYETTGGRFDSPEPVETVSVGTMTLDFTDCNSAVLEFELPGEGRQGVIELERLQPGAQGLCEELAGVD